MPIPRFRQFWQEFKRRRMFSAGAFYVVAAWAVVQAASIAFPAFGVSDWAMRALLVASFAGFPVALILAWMFDVTAAGIEVTAPAEGAYPRGRRPPRWWLRPLVAAPILAAIVGGTAWLWTARLEHSGESEFTRPLRPDELPVVAVLPLENLTGRSELAWTGEGVANLVRNDLAQSRYLVVVSAARTLRLSDEASDVQALLTAASEAGVTHVLSGEILRTPKGITITSRLTDLRRNIEVGANRQEGLAPEETLTVSTAIASVIKQALGLPGTEKVDVFSADFAARNIAAYEAFIAGMENFLRFDYPEARRAFEAAVGKAPDFAMARYRLAHTLASLGDTDGALAQVRAASAEAARLPARERAYIAAGESYFQRQYGEAERRYRELLRDYPYETEARLLLLYVLIDQDRFEEALIEAETLAAQDPGDEVAWSAQADLNLKVGRYERADEALAKLIALAPENPNAHYLLGESLLRRGQFDAAARGYEQALQADPNFGDAALRLAHVGVLQNRPEAAIARLTPLPDDTRLAPSLRISAAFDLAYLLRALRRCPEAEAVLERLQPELAAEQVREAMALATRARCRIDSGDVAGARTLAQQAVEQSPGIATRYLFARGLAEIAANDAAALEATVDEVDRLAAGAEDGARERKAADYLRGLARLHAGDAAGAVTVLRAAVQTEGYEYDVYALALARALAATGARQEARKLAREAAARGEPADLRLDLEYDRREAARLLRELVG